MYQHSMSLAKLLHLDHLDLPEEKIIKELQQAYKDHKEEIVFRGNGHVVKIKVQDVFREGILPRGYDVSHGE